MWKEIEASLDPWEATPGGDREPRKLDHPLEKRWSTVPIKAEPTILDVLRNWSDHTDAPMIAEELIEAQSPRAQGFNYGVGWGSSPKPEIYFDGVKIGNVLQRIAHDATANAWAMTHALREVRLAETPTEKANALHSLYELVRKFEEDREVKIALKVEELANAIDVIAPPNPKGYVPNMGIHYAVSPLRKIIDGIRLAFKQGT